VRKSEIASDSGFFWLLLLFKPPNAMLLFPDCKINIGLRVVSRRDDGYHEIETVMYPIRGLCDAVEILPSDRPGVEFVSSGLRVDSPSEKNLCVRAYRAVAEKYPLGGVRIHLHKVVPMGAGLGGGSADAAFVIRGLSALFSLGLSGTEMERIAAGIGSDTAFFVADRPALATGRGEVLSPVSLPLSGYRIVIVKPDESVSTAEAYSHVVPRVPERPLVEALSAPVETWRETVANDFEASVFRNHPALASLKETLYRCGALYASMSGSGAAVYGIFDRTAAVPDAFGDVFVHQEIMA